MSLFGKPTPKSVFGSQPPSAFGGQQAGGSHQISGNASQATARQVKPATTSLFFKKTSSSQDATVNSVTPQSVFGNAKQQVVAQPTAPPPNKATSLFGKPSGTSAFGGGQPSPTPVSANLKAPQPHSTSLFASKTPPGAYATPAANEQARTLFGKPVAERTVQMAETMATLYSQMADLTVDEVAAFNADEFSLGSIPIKPPPQEACYG